MKDKTYHDVLFKYGSLLAVEAKSGDAFSTDDIVWKPITYATPAAAWSGIPYQTTGNVPDNTVADVAAALGDPCKLAMLSDDKIKEGTVDNGQWHMATNDELQRLINGKDDIKQGHIDNPDGFQSYSSLLIPNTYSRDAAGTNTTGTKLTGSYWSSEGGNVFRFIGLNNANPLISPSLYQEVAYTVRCVRRTPDVVLSKINLINNLWVEYTGGGVRVNVESNIPYWEIKCLDSGYETALSFNNDIYSGKNNGSIVVDFKRWVEPRTRSFNFRITGYGYDGQSITQDFVITQQRYYWSLAAPDYTRLTPTPVKDPKSNNYILSADETEYTVHIQVYPDIADIPLPSDAEVKIQFVANGIVVAETSFQPLNSLRQAFAKITIPANTSGSMRGVYMQIVGQGTAGGDGKFIPSNRPTYYLQDYKK